LKVFIISQSGRGGKVHASEEEGWDFVNPLGCSYGDLMVAFLGASTKIGDSCPVNIWHGL
jgi:hypothetical protein